MGLFNRKKKDKEAKDLAQKAVQEMAELTAAESAEEQTAKAADKSPEVDQPAKYIENKPKASEDSTETPEPVQKTGADSKEPDKQAEKDDKETQPEKKMGFFAKRRAQKKARQEKAQAGAQSQGQEKDSPAQPEPETPAKSDQARQEPCEQAKEASDQAGPSPDQDKPVSEPLAEQGETEAVREKQKPEPKARPAEKADPQPEEPPSEPEPEAEPDEPEKAVSPGTQEQAGEKRQEAPSEPGKEQGFFSRLSSRLGKTRDKISGSIDKITLGRKIDEELLDELEEVLITADMGMPTTMKLMDNLRGKVRRSELTDVEALKKALAKGIEGILSTPEPAPERDNNPHVILVIGVNGVGKTTSIGKLAHYFTKQGKKVLLAAGDTFRAAAAEQLEVWAERTGCPIVRQRHGADPSAVAYDALEAALSRERDLVLIDTAGRLHTKVNLMDELRKIHRVIQKRLPGAPHEVLLVLDATTGQNALSQAKLFNQAVPLTGLVLTKLDGTAKGGIVVSISSEMQTPVCFVGIGEGIDDLRPFEPADFAKAIF
ncbi:signal recognition particle-docking protein FtsY [Dethiosulfatarculus sandiegensis]|uniref:Signal recognition particle receptor FtsY n=1 Tax=Dethiosulfatarculus sandiegensis TaxID=1429043 RepID=A0A0D2JVX9_9BACT|nr:signal recognition particle-docking protein FtsY [Dethiosulfatarculus sandiegensis]KIX13775.1 cell division protein FtsY [Dethiosulfatarculus sandiegensis]